MPMWAALLLLLCRAVSGQLVAFAADQGLRVNFTHSIGDARFGAFDPDRRCGPAGRDGPAPAVIHVVMIATANIVEEMGGSRKGKYFANKQSVMVYCRLHGYTFHLVRPERVLRSYGFDYNQKMRARYNSAGWVVFSKPIVILYTLYDLFHRFGCSVRHVLFVDADVFVVDLEKALEAMIRNADANYADHSSVCALIAQDAPTTINTGALIFRMSARSEAILTRWIDNQYRLANVLDIVWQDEQGWLQLTYLQHAAAVRGAPEDAVNCAVENILTVRKYARHKTLGETPLRSKCYASALAQLQLQLLSPAKGKPFSRSTGDMCLLPGLSSLDRLNLHDMPGRARWIDGVRYIHVLRVPRGDTRGGEEDGRCGLAGALLYHGKSAVFTARLQKVYGLTGTDANNAQVFNYSSESARVFIERNKNNVYSSDEETCFREINAIFAAAAFL